MYVTVYVTVHEDSIFSSLSPFLFPSDTAGIVFLQRQVFLELLFVSFIFFQPVKLLVLFSGAHLCMLYNRSL